MSEEVITRIIITAVGVLITLAIFSALSGYYEMARDQAKTLTSDATPSTRYDKTIEETFDKDELFGYEAKNLVNYYMESPLVRVDIHNSGYLNEIGSVVFRSFLNANDSEYRSDATSYEDAANLILPMQTFKVYKFEDGDYTTYVLNGRYDLSREASFHVEHMNKAQIETLLDYYKEDTYVVVEVLNVQQLVTTQFTDPVTGQVIPQIHVETRNFYNANNSLVTSVPGKYNEAKAYITSNQDFVVRIEESSYSIKYIITGENIR